MNIVLGKYPYTTTFDFSLPEIENIGVFFSGGLDSTILMCLIIDEIKKTNKPIKLHAFTMYKPTGETDYAPRLLNLISNHYNIDITHKNNIPNREPFISLGRMDMEQIKVVYDEYKFNIQLYLAGNNMPPKTVKDFGEIQLGFVYSNTMYYKYPFINLLKSQMIDLYNHLGVDFLIPYTHSCSQQPVGKCNMCWSCTERSWGFKMLGLTDPETIKFRDSIQ